MSGAPAAFSLVPLTFADIEGWSEDDPSPLFSALGACLAHLRGAKPYRAGSLGLTTDDLMPLLEAASCFSPASAGEARRFFEEHCVPFAIRLDSGGQGFVTGFYEPEVEVSSEPDDLWRYPFHRRPADLVDVDEGNRPADMPADYRFARRDENGSIGFYPDRGEIDRGVLKGRDLEIAWAKSRVDVFFAHVQGAARLVYPDGSVRRITYAAKAGHPFTGIGKVLIERGDIDPSTVSMQTIRAWLAAHPEAVDEVLWHNRSYIFFRDADVADLQAGPIAAAKVPLVAGRSLAVDRNIHTFGFPFFVSAATLTHLDDGRPFRRLLLALDTGSAIIGPARGDIFTGSGFEAGQMAGTIRNAADFVILVPNKAVRRLLA